MKTNIYFPELEAELKAGIESSNQKVRNDASADGKRNLPGVDDDIEFYFESHHHSYNKLIGLIYSTAQMGSKCLSVLECGQLFNEARLKLDNAERITRDRLVDVEQALKGFKVRLSGGFIFFVLAIVLAVTDGLFNQPFFEFKGADYWVSFVLSFGFGIILFTIPHYIVPFFRSKLSEKEYNMFTWVLSMGLAVLFYFMARGRVIASTNETVGLVCTEAYPYMIVSSLMFLVTVIMSRIYHEQKKKAPLLNTAREQELKAEKTTLKKELNRIELEYTKLNKKEQEEREYARALFEYASGLRQRIIEEAQQAYFLYKKNNRLNRTDGIIPPCLQYTDYPFSFSSYFELSKEQPPFQRSSAIVAFICAIGLGLSSCNFSSEAPVIDSCNVIMIDTTDPLLVYPDIDQMEHVLKLEDNLWQGVEVHVGTINDRDVNSIHSMILPKENRITGNIQERQNRVGFFQLDLVDALAKCRPQNPPYLNHSIIYRTLVEQLNMLAKSTAKNKNLVVYSNLYENSDLANFYDPKTFKILQNTPGKILGKFMDAEVLYSLDGINVWLVYQPIDYQDNLHYMEVSKLYRDLFSAEGATVHIVASL